MAVLSASVPADLKLDKVDKELQFLQLRQQLKASIRDQMKKENASLFSNSQEKKKLTRPINNYRSSFGCSQPSIAPRVLQDTKIMAEFKQLAARHMKPAASKTVVPTCRINAHELKASRDYSFIFSDNAENPTLSASTSGNKNLKPCQLKSPKCKVNPDEQQIPLSKLHSIRKEKGKTSPEPWKAEVKSTTKPIVEEKIEYVEPKTKSKHLTSSKAEASELQKADLLKPQIEQKKDDRLKAVKVVMLNKVKQPCGALIGSKVSKKQVGPEKQLHGVKEVMLAPQPRGKSLPKHQIKQSPMQETLYDDEVNQSYEISSLCQSLFRRNHNKHARNYDSDYDDDCRVASFDEIQKEEKRSARLARKEDRIEQLGIEQEEREERLKRRAKKQKLQ